MHRAPGADPLSTQGCLAVMQLHTRLLPSSFAVAALAAVAGAASPQSNVTIYGRVDLSLAQQADAIDNKEVRNGSGNRLGFKGTEELGDGLRAVFQLEHRFNGDDGKQTTDRFW